MYYYYSYLDIDYDCYIENYYLNNNGVWIINTGNSSNGGSATDSQTAYLSATEFETGKVNTLKYMNRVINHIFNSYNPRKPRYSDLVYYYWIEECCRYLFKRKYSW